MADFDNFQVKLTGVDDNGMLHATVRLGFWDVPYSERHDIDVPVLLEANLDASLRELREQAKVRALTLLQKATQLLEQHSTDELHQVAQDQFEKHGAEQDARLQDEIGRSLSGRSA